jgi:high-affinity iron transporter
MKRILLFFFVLLPMLAAATMILYSSRQNQPLLQDSDSPTQAGNGKEIVSDDSQAAPELAEDGQRLVFLLQYIGNDYAEAVRNDRIVNPLEFREMQEFANTLVAEYQSSERVEEQTLIKLQQLEKMIAQKASPKKVRDICTELVTVIADERNLLVFPAVSPDLAEGKELFQDNCAACHGILGRGDGPAADTLNPGPRDFTDAAHLNGFAPYQLYQAITLGVEGTAMPSFDQAFTAKQRWNLAFYLMTLRRDFRPQPPLPNQRLTLRQLATLSNLDLEKILSAQADSTGDASTPAASGVVDYFRLHFPQLTTEEYLTIAERRLRQSFAAYRHNDGAKALQLALDAYLHGFEPIELQLDASMKTEIESAFHHYSRCLEERQPHAPTKASLNELLGKLNKARTTTNG